MSVVDEILERALIAVIGAPIEERLLDWALAVSKGGIGVLGVPVTLPTVTEVVSDLSDEAGLVVGVSDIREPEQISVAVAAGAELILSPVVDWTVIEQAKMRGLSVIAGAFTPSEVHTAFRAGADLVALHPVGVLAHGEAYFQSVLQSFQDKPLLVSGGIDVENAPSFLELGARAAIVDRGVFPDTNDPAALEIITMRAAALTEVCADVCGTPKRLSLTDLRVEALAPAAESDFPSDIQAAISDVVGNEGNAGENELALDADALVAEEPKEKSNDESNDEIELELDSFEEFDAP